MSAPSPIVRPVATRSPSPRVRAQRAVVVDVVLALVIAGLLLVLTAGLGVVAFIAVPIGILIILSVLAERTARRVRSRRRARQRRF